MPIGLADIARVALGEFRLELVDALELHPWFGGIHIDSPAGQVWLGLTGRAAIHGGEQGRVVHLAGVHGDHAVPVETVHESGKQR